MTIKFTNPNNPLRRTAAIVAPNGVAITSKTQPTARTAPIPTGRVVTASKKDEALVDSDGTFNPVRANGSGSPDRQSIRAALSGSNSGSRVYDSKGEINAYDKKDALVQAAYVMNNAAGRNAYSRMTRSASREEVEMNRKVLAEAMSDDRGMALIGQELALPIKQIVDYEGFIRKIYRVRSLAQGEFFRIAKDVRATAYVVGQDGKSIASRPYGSYIQPDETKITSFVEVDLMEIYQMNFDVLQRMQDTARQEIELEEDKRGIRLLDRAARAANPVTGYSGSISLATFEALRYNIERHRLLVDKYVINRAELSDVLGFGPSTVDPVTQRELNLAGYFGRLYGAHVMVCAGLGNETVVAAGTTYAMVAPEYLGEMGVRVELYSEPYNGMVNHETIKGFGFVEVCGFGIPAPKGAAVAVKS